MANFKTYCLSLKTDIKRREWMLSIKDKIGLDFTFFDATTPDEITDEIIERYFKYVDFYEWDINQKAVMATFISHMNLLRLAIQNKENILIIEDDIYPIQKMDWNKIDFSTFDVYKISKRGVYCYSYFVSYEGAKKLLNYLNNKIIKVAYDWELHMCRELNIQTIDSPIFVQTNTFPSNIAPNGYHKIKENSIKLIWTLADIDSIYSIENNKMSIDKKSILISYYKESINRAKSFGYYTIIYCSNTLAKDFINLVDEVIIAESYDNSPLWDNLKIKVLEERADDFCLIDGDLILEKKLPIFTTECVFDGYEFGNWEWAYKPIIKQLTDLGIADIIDVWDTKRIPVINCGLMYINNLNLKKEYIDKWKLINQFIIQKKDEHKIEIHYATMIATQYLLTLLVKKYDIKVNEYFDNYYVHHSGKQKFQSPLFEYKDILNSKIIKKLI